jgi:hypothetical protein
VLAVVTFVTRDSFRPGEGMGVSRGLPTVKAVARTIVDFARHVEFDLEDWLYSVWPAFRDDCNFASNGSHLPAQVGYST